MIHEGTLQDRPHFMRLYFEFQKSQAEKGSYFLPSVHNLNLSKGIFEQCAEGSLEGFTLFWIPQNSSEPVSFLMGSTDPTPNPYELTLGKLAILWAVYVEPSHRGQGITMKLFQRATEMAIGMGYKSILTYVLSSNPHGERVAIDYGVRPAVTEYITSIDKTMLSPEFTKGIQRETT